MNEQLKKRLKSFAWRLVMVALAAVVAYLLQNLNVLDLPAWVTVVLGLALGELSKWLNSQQQEPGMDYL